MKIARVTAVLFVESIEASLAFWRDALGFTVTIAVPDEAPLAFAAVTRDGCEVMLQTLASVAEDMPHLAASMRDARGALYLETDDLAAVERALAAFPIAMPRRETFYGAQECGWREPGGHHVTFAQFAAPGTAATTE